MTALKVLLSTATLMVTGILYWFLGGVIPKIIGHMATSTEQSVVTAAYYVTILASIVVPQYFIWVKDDGLPFHTPIISVGVMAGTILAISILFLVTSNLLGSLTLSDSAQIIHYVIYWIAIGGSLYVPQHFIYKPHMES